MHFDEPAAPEPPPEPAYRMVGTLRVGIPLFNIFLNEADEQSRRLGVELAEWSHEFAERPVGDGAIALAHSLAGNSASGSATATGVGSLPPPQATSNNASAAGTRTGCAQYRQAMIRTKTANWIA